MRLVYGVASALVLELVYVVTDAMAVEAALIVAGAALFIGDYALARTRRVSAA